MLNIQKIKSDLLLNLKNLPGWKSDRKIVVFSVDDYGNVRVDSKIARDRMDRDGLKTFLRFDAFDALENREDLEVLFDTLDGVKDKNGSPAIFTAFSLPCNVDFEKVVEGNFEEYHYELLPETYKKLSAKNSQAYEGTWELWQEGISNGLLNPQFHGREHINLKVFNEKIRRKDRELISALKNRSYTSLSSTGYSTIDWSAAFDFWDVKETNGFKTIIEDGLDAFEKVFGFRSTHFNAPGRPEHHSIHKYLSSNGIKYIDSPLVKKEHQGLNKFAYKVNYLGKQNYQDMYYNVRNVVFEPSDDVGLDWVNYTLRQIEVAFRWHHPAVISSHRVNFCGHISEENRKTGIKSLKLLLKEIVNRWPDVEFLSSVELMKLVSDEKNLNQLEN